MGRVMKKKLTKQSLSWIGMNNARRDGRWANVSACLASSLLLLVSSAPVFAADAGSLLQQIEKERVTPLPKKAPLGVQQSPQAMPASPGLSVNVSAFQFSGNTLLSNQQLNEAVSAYVNKTLNFNELQQAAAAVAELYRQSGWVVRVYLPQQDIQNGIVTIQIVEAVFGKASQEGASVTRVNAARIQSTIDAVQANGQPINTEKLDRALLVLDDLPGVVASGSLRGGAREGETDVILKVTDEAFVTGDLGIDNTGSRSTGRARLSASFSLNSPLQFGDQASGNLIHTDGSDYVRLAYSVPVAYDGWRVGASASNLNYKLVADEFVAMNGKGSSSTVGLDSSYPIIRSRKKNLYALFNYDHKSFDNQANQATTSNYDIDEVSASISGNLFDDYFGGGVNSASAAVVQGHVALGSLDLAESASLNGNFSKLRYSLSRQQKVTEKVSLYGALSGQQANKTLDSSEKFYLGGSSGVRAYPASEGGGSSGNLVNFELRWNLPANFNLVGFYDIGRIKNYDGSKSYSLSGAGLTLGWQASNGLSVKGTWAHRIGNNPNPMANGNDEDGSLIKDRLWVQANLPF